MSAHTRLSFRKDFAGDIDLDRWLAEAETCPPTPLWVDRALCHGRTELFYSDHRKDVLDAVNYCKACPVSRACASYAVDQERFHASSRIDGVQAGLTAKQRKAAYNMGRRTRRPTLWAS